MSTNLFENQEQGAPAEVTYILPVELCQDAGVEKSDKDAGWRIRGIASTESKDLQGDVIVQEGIVPTVLAQLRGKLNYEHRKGPEDIIGVIDFYKKTQKGFYIEGRLFKNHARAQAVQSILSSLDKKDQGRVGLSIEASVLERDTTNPKIITKCLIRDVAITMNPVNQDTYVDLVKSLGDASLVFGDGLEIPGAAETSAPNKWDIFTITRECLAEIEKSLDLKKLTNQEVHEILESSVIQVFKSFK